MDLVDLDPQGGGGEGGGQDDDGGGGGHHGVVNGGQGGWGVSQQEYGNYCQVEFSH